MTPPGKFNDLNKEQGDCDVDFGGADLKGVDKGFDAFMQGYSEVGDSLAFYDNSSREQSGGGFSASTLHPYGNFRPFFLVSLVLIAELNHAYRRAAKQYYSLKLFITFEGKNHVL